MVTLEERLLKKFKKYKFGEDCKVHNHTSYVPLEDHHVWPKEYHGPDVASNLIRVCSNGHGEIHYFLELLLATGKSTPIDALKVVPSEAFVRFGRRVRMKAVDGFKDIMQAQVTEEGLK